MSQNGQTHFENIADYVLKSLKEPWVSLSNLFFYAMPDKLSGWM